MMPFGETYPLKPDEASLNKFNVNRLKTKTKDGASIFHSGAVQSRNYHFIECVVCSSMKQCLHLFPCC